MVAGIPRGLCVGQHHRPCNPPGNTSLEEIIRVHGAQAGFFEKEVNCILYNYSQHLSTIFNELKFTQKYPGVSSFLRLTR